MRTTETIAALLLSVALCCAASGAPRVEVTSTTAGDLTILDASKSTGTLVWRIKGQHWLIDDGKIAVCRGDYIAAIAAVADGQLDLVLLPDGADIPDDPPPSGSLTERVRTLSLELPLDQRAKVAAVHADLAERLRAGEGDTFAALKAIVESRKESMEDALGDAWNDWADFDAGLTRELEALRAALKLDTADHFAEAFEAVAEGLK